jgi:hypothetical protein
MQALYKLRDDLRREVDSLSNQLKGVELAIAVASGARRDTPRRPKSTKQAILDYLALSEGLNAAMIVQFSEADGYPIPRATASSLLSRFKSDGLVVYDGRLYRLNASITVATQSPRERP